MHLNICEATESIYKKVIAAGVKIINEIERFEFGGQTFSCEDLEFQVWVFTRHDPWLKTW